jgi:hypothetical protein
MADWLALPAVCMYVYNECMCSMICVYMIRVVSKVRVIAAAITQLEAAVLGGTMQSCD